MECDKPVDTNAALMSPVKSQHEKSEDMGDTSEIAGITKLANITNAPVNNVDIAETTDTVDIVDSLVENEKLDSKNAANVNDTSVTFDSTAFDTVDTGYTSDTATDLDTAGTVAKAETIDNESAKVVENIVSQVDTTAISIPCPELAVKEINTSVNVKSAASEAIESETPQSSEVELADYNNSLSETGSEHESGNEPNMGSDSSLDNYDHNRIDTRQQDPDDVTSTDGDNEDGGDKDGNYDEQLEDEECRAELVAPKESPQPPRKVDDDEDKNNPQYIPKRGTFYEHDYRTTEDLPDEEKPDTEKERADGAADGKKKMWLEKRESWSHDKFKDEDQLPKSRDELIAIYGYDIRNEDGPPRARRRRRYGRGPNKYTRNWEDEDAYYKSSVKKQPPQQQRGADQAAQPPQSLEPSPLGRQPQQVRESPRIGASKFARDQPQSREHVHVQQEAARGGPNRVQQSAGTGRIVWPNRDYAASDYKSFTKARNFNRSEHPQSPQYTQQRSQHETGNRHQQRQNTPPGGRYQDNRDANVTQVDMAMGSLSLNDSSQQNIAERKPVSKRYSSIRQRPLPETPAKITTIREAMEAHHKANADIERERQRAVGNVLPMPQQQQQHYYEDSNDYNSAQQQQQVAQQPPQMNVAMCPPPPQLAMPPMPDAAAALAQLSAAGRQLQQQRFVGGVGPPLPPTTPQFGLSPPQFLPRPPQPPPININYQLPPQHYYPHQQAPPPPQFVSQVATEQLFQPQGGITYYSPEEQQTMQRHAPPARPKVAIPILPPPPTPPPINNSSSDGIS